jgi:hypothetical protein
MIDYETAVDHSWNRIGCGCVVVSALVVALLVGAIASRAQGAAADQPLCQAVLNAQWPESIEGVEWIGYPKKWEGVPLSTFDQEPLLLPLGEWEDGAYALYRLEDGSDLIIPMYTLLQDTPDMHTVCPDVVKWNP